MCCVQIRCAGLRYRHLATLPPCRGFISCAVLPCPFVGKHFTTICSRNTTTGGWANLYTAALHGALRWRVHVCTNNYIRRTQHTHTHTHTQIHTRARTNTRLFSASWFIRVERLAKRLCSSALLHDSLFAVLRPYHLRKPLRVKVK